MLTRRAKHISKTVLQSPHPEEELYREMKHFLTSSSQYEHHMNRGNKNPRFFSEIAVI